MKLIKIKYPQPSTANPNPTTTPKNLAASSQGCQPLPMPRLSNLDFSSLLGQQG